MLKTQFKINAFICKYFNTVILMCFYATETGLNTVQCFYINLKDNNNNVYKNNLKDNNNINVYKNDVP